MAIPAKAVSGASSMDPAIVVIDFFVVSDGRRSALPAHSLKQRLLLQPADFGRGLHLVRWYLRGK